MTVHVHYTCDSLTVFTSYSEREYRTFGRFALNLNPLHYSTEVRYLSKRLKRLGISLQKAERLARAAMDSIRAHREEVVYDW